MRLVAVRKTEEAAGRAGKKLRRLRLKKGQTTTDSPEALEAAQYVFLVTSLSREEASAEDIGEAYRWRWQIELNFKRWKSLLHLDNIRAKTALARTYILTKLLVAILVDAAITNAAISPWGTPNLRAARKAA